MIFKETELINIQKEIIDYRGKTPKKLGSDWSEYGYRALSAKNIKTGKIVQPDTIRFVDEELYKKWMKQEVERGTILITSEAPFGELLYWDSDEKIVLSQRLFGVKIKDDFCAKYIYYYMTSNMFYNEMKSRATGSTVIGLRQPELLKCKIKFPEYNNQVKISRILSSIDDKIEINNKINNNLYELSHQLLKNYLETADADEIKISELLNVFTGKKNANETSVDGKYKFFSCAPESLLSDTYIHDGAAIIVAGNGAYTARTRFYEGKFELYQRTYALTLKDNLNKNLIYGLYVYMKSYFEKDKMGGTHGSAIPYIVLSDLTDYKLKYNKIEFERLSNNIACNIKKIQENEKMNETLSQLRDTLLPKLMNGEIDLDNIEI